MLSNQTVYQAGSLTVPQIQLLTQVSLLQLFPQFEIAAPSFFIYPISYCVRIVHNQHPTGDKKWWLMAQVSR